MRERVDSPVVEVQILRVAANQVPSDGPDILPVAGMTRQRQQHLFTFVRPYVRAACQDTTCPRPLDDD